MVNIELEQVQELVNIFFDKMWLQIDSIEVEKEWNNIFAIKISTPESSLLIWYSGSNLKDLRNVLSLMLSVKYWEKVILHIEVNDYIQNKDQKLFSYIESKIKLLDKWQIEVVLPSYNSYERKKIHSYVAWLKRNDLKTESRGEWRNRRMYLLKSFPKLTIDLEWLDI